MKYADPFDLAGNVVCITGAGSGIGEAAAHRMAGAGARLVLGDRDTDALARVAEELRNSGAALVAEAVDITSRSDVDRLAEAALVEYGQIDTWCNIAGVGCYGPLADATDADLDRTFGINLRGTLYGCQAAMAAMAPRGRGSIVNVSATAIYTPAAGVGVYAASKAAVAMLTQTLAVEAGPLGIRVNALAPGFTVTNFVGGHLRDEHGERDPEAFTAYLDQMRAMSPLGVLGTADDQAWQLVYLASDASKFVTGAILRANGGQGIGW